MGFFDIFRRKRTPKNEAESSIPLETRKWNKMWEMWRDDRIPSPYRELMTYQTDMEKGGYNYYFAQRAAERRVAPSVEAVLSLLGDTDSAASMSDAYAAYEKYAGIDEDELKRILDECDYIYFDSKEEITEILKGYADSIEP